MSVKIKKIAKNNFLEILICIFSFGTLAYCITGDFNYDDVTYFYFRGRELLEECTFADILKMAQEAWLRRGRFSPAALLWSYVIYYIFTDFLYYELFLIFFTVLDVFLFGIMIEIFTKSKRCKLLSMLGLSLFFQVYTIYHNALVGYAALLQFSVLLTLLQLIFLCEYLQKKKKRFLVLSIACQIISVATYEFNYFNVFMAACVLFKERRRIQEIIKIISLYCIPLFFIGSYSVYINILSKQAGAIYEGSKIHFHFIRMIETLFKQLMATVPLFNYFNNKNGILDGNILTELNLMDIGILALFILVYVLIVRNVSGETIEKPNKWLFCLALILFISPSILPSMTSKYQNELLWGIAHIAVFEQYFGLCFLLSLFMIKMINFIQKMESAKRWIRLFRIVGFTGMFCICIVNLAVENRYIMHLQTVIKYPKAALEHALKNNILEDIKENDILLVPQAASYDSSAFYSQQTGKKVHAYTLDEFRQLSESKVEESHIYVIHKYGTKELEMVLLGEVDKINYDDLGSPVSYDVDQIKIYRNAEFSEICFEDQTVSISEMIVSEDDVYSYSFQEPVNFFEITVV